MLPAGMYAGHPGVVGHSKFIKEDKVFTSDLQVRCLCLLRGTLGVKRTTTDWAVCLKGVWTRVTAVLLVQICCQVVRNMLELNSETLSRVLKVLN